MQKLVRVEPDLEFSGCQGFKGDVQGLLYWWLRLGGPNARILGSILYQGTRSHVAQSNQIKFLNILKIS